MKKLLIIIATVCLVLGLNYGASAWIYVPAQGDTRLADLHLYRRRRGVHRHGRVCGRVMPLIILPIPNCSWITSRGAGEPTRASKLATLQDIPRFLRRPS